MCILITFVCGAVWLTILHANRALGCPHLLRKVFTLKDSLKMYQEHQFLKRTVARSKAKQNERTLYLEFRRSGTDQNAINTLHLLVVPFDFFAHFG